MKTIFIFLVSLISFSSHAEAPSVGATKAVTCTACHGPKGLSANPLWPNLAGQKYDYLVKQLHDFKAGRRQDPLMSPMANILSEQDILDVAKYFSSL